MDIMGSLCLSMLALQVSFLGVVLTQNGDGECITYDSELKSRPDLTHRVMYESSPLPPGYSIVSMEIDATRQRSFYWCELKLSDGDQVKTYRHFGHNTTHMWVEKGCGAWFIVTACNNTVTTNNNDAGLSATLPTDSTISKPLPLETRKQLDLSDLRQGALLSLRSWLADKSGRSV